MTQFIVIVQGIIHAENQILIAKKRLDLPHPLRGEWHFPGGKLKNKEDPYNAIIREIKEETNLTVRPVKIIDIYTHTDSHDLPNNEILNILHIIFECIPSTNDCKMRPGDDIVEAKWIRAKDIRKFIVKDKLIRRIRIKNLLTYLA